MYGRIRVIVCFTQDVVPNVVPDVVQGQYAFNEHIDSCTCLDGKMWSKMWSRIIIYIYNDTNIWLMGNILGARVSQNKGYIWFEWEREVLFLRLCIAIIDQI